jgi:hypothetical protein
MRPEGQKIAQNIGIAVGTLGGLLGMTVAIAAAPLYGSLFSLFFIVVFGLAFGLPYLRNRKRKQLLATGRQADGLITEMWDTGVTINNQPQIGMKIQVTPQTGPPFTSEVIMVVSRLQTAYYQVGVQCIVKYDPADTKTVAIESLGNSLGSSSKSSSNYSNYTDQSSGYQQQTVTGSPFFPGKTTAQIDVILTDIAAESNKILATGIECKGIIKSSTWTNIYVNGENPLNYFEIEVLPDNKPAFEAKCYAVISEASKEKYQPGKQIWVKYDQNDMSKITMSHS